MKKKFEVGSWKPEVGSRKPEAGMPEIVPGIVRTYSGKLFNVTEPNPDDINIIDIAHALSNQCRFGGHTSHFYSVAEHSVHVATGLPMHHALAGLLHDASEAYLVDLPTPVKLLFPDYFKTEYRLMEAIAEKFGFDYPLHGAVEKEDKWMLEREWENLIEAQEHTTLMPVDAENSFLKLFDLLKF